MTARRRTNDAADMAERIQRDFLGGAIRLHVLHHAAVGEVFGQGLIEELGRHGYRLSAGTLYPILHALERGGYLRSTERLVDGRIRRMYSATPAGRSALQLSRASILELVDELFGGAKPRHRAAAAAKGR